jgi:hypothetical protein
MYIYTDTQKIQNHSKNDYAQEGVPLLQVICPPSEHVSHWGDTPRGPV